MPHTKGPWIKRLGGITAPSASGIAHQSIGSFMVNASENAGRAVACVNGCDSAGITKPVALTNLIVACEHALDWQEGVEEMRPEGEGTPQNTLSWMADLRSALDQIRS